MSLLSRGAFLLQVSPTRGLQNLLFLCFVYCRVFAECCCDRVPSKVRLAELMVCVCSILVLFVKHCCCMCCAIFEPQKILAEFAVFLGFVSALFAELCRIVCMCCVLDLMLLLPDSSFCLRSCCGLSLGSCCVPDRFC